MAVIPRHIARNAAMRQEIEAAAETKTRQRQKDAYDRWAATASPDDLIEMEMAAINRQTYHARQARLLDARQRRGRR